eukprot:1289904-Karenia_brevis.AAC.1
MTPWSSATGEVGETPSSVSLFPFGIMLSGWASSGFGPNLLCGSGCGGVVVRGPMALVMSAVGCGE